MYFILILDVLLFFTEKGHFSVVEILLKNGADKAAQDSHGRTPLFCSAQSHSCQAVELLLVETPPSLINLR